MADQQTMRLHPTDQHLLCALAHSFTSPPAYVPLLSSPLTAFLRSSGSTLSLPSSAAEAFATRSANSSDRWPCRQTGGEGERREEGER